MCSKKQSLKSERKTRGQGSEEAEGNPPCRLYAILELPRPLNCLITFASVLLGGWLGIHTLTAPLLHAAISAALITGGGNTLNDLCGLTEDRINKPHRPLPSGRLSLTIARVETGILLLTGLGLSLRLPAPTLAIGLMAITSLVLYNVYLKRVPFLGNTTVSALGGVAFLYGGAAVETLSAPILIAAFAFLFHLGREILKDLQDSKGDRKFTGTTIPLFWGESTSRILITAIFTLLILLTPFPAIIGEYAMPYLILVVLLDLLLIFVLIRLWQHNTPQTLGFLSHLLKAGMVLGLAAFFFDHL